MAATTRAQPSDRPCPFAELTDHDHMVLVDDEDGKWICVGCRAFGSVGADGELQIGLRYPPEAEKQTGPRR